MKRGIYSKVSLYQYKYAHYFLFYNIVLEFRLNTKTNEANLLKEFTKFNQVRILFGLNDNNSNQNS